MKSKMKRLSKSTLSVILAVIMVLSTAVVGIVTSNAAFTNLAATGDNQNYFNYVHFAIPSTWNMSGKTLYLAISWGNNYYRWMPMTLLGNNLYYVSGNNAYHASGQQRVRFVVGGSTTPGDGTVSDDDFSSYTYYTEAISYGLNNSSNYYGFFLDDPDNPGTTNVQISGNWNADLGSCSNAGTKIELYTNGSSSYTGGKVAITGRSFNGATLTKDNNVASTGSNTSYTYYSPVGYNVTLTANAESGYTFDGFYDSSDNLLSDESPYSFIAYAKGGSPKEIRAKFMTETKYTITKGSNNDNYGTVTSDPASQVVKGNNVTFTAAPEDGYLFEGWYSDSACTTRYTGTSAYPESKTLTVSNVQANVAVYGKFVEKQRQTVTVTAPTNGSVTVTGSTVSGNSSVTVASGGSTTTFTAHVDDELTITATPDAGSTDYGYKLESLTVAGQVISSGDTYTVVSGTDPTITANFAQTTTYRIKVHAGTGGTTTMKIGDGEAVTITADQAQNFDVPWASGYTVSWTANTGAQFSKTTKTLNGTSTDQTSGSNATGTNADDGAVYRTKFNATTAWPPSTISGFEEASDDNSYIWVASNNALSNDSYTYYCKSTSSDYKVLKNGSKYWITLSSSNLAKVKKSDTNFYVAFSTTSAHSGIAGDAEAAIDSTYNHGVDSSGTQGYNFSDANDKKFVYFNTDTTDYSTISYIGILVDLSNSSKPKYTIYSAGSGTSSGDSEYDPFYVGGRFTISNGTDDVSAGTDEWNFAIDSTKIKWTKDPATGYYKLETNKTIAELSPMANTDGTSGYTDQLFVVHDKVTHYAVYLNDYSGNSFQNCRGESNALTLMPVAKANLGYANEIMFDDKDNTSNGKVVIWIDSKDYAEGNSASTLKIWYTVEDETPAVADKLTLSISPQSVYEGDSATLTATVTGLADGVSKSNLKFVFKNSSGTVIATVTGESITELASGGFRATTTVTNAEANSYTYSVTVSKGDEAANPRPVSKSVTGTWKARTVYYTSDITASAASPTWTGIDTTTKFATISTTLAAGNSYTIALSDAEAYNPDFPDFTIATEYNQYCDITMGSKTVTINDEDRVVRTYVVTPRTNCKNPTIYIDAATGKIYAVATYDGDTTGKTLDSDETVTYYFAERVGDEGISNATSTNQTAGGTGKGMRIRYWNSSVQTGSSSSDCMGQVDVYTQATNKIGDTTYPNTIYVNLDELYTKNSGRSGANQFYVYKVELPIGATAFKFLDSSSNVVETEYLWSQDWGKGTASDVLNPNRIYLLYNGNSSGGSGCYYRTQGVILDDHLWTQAESGATNQVSIKNFDSNLINYTDLTHEKDNVTTDTVNTSLSAAYNTKGTPHTLYFGDFNGASNVGFTRYYDYKNLAQRANNKAYYAAVQDLVGARLSTSLTNENGYAYLMDTQGVNDKGISKAAVMPLFDYTQTTSGTYDIVTAGIASAVYEGLKFPMNVSEHNGITTYSYDSTTDYNRIYSGSDFKVQEDSDTVACEAGNDGYKNYVYGKDSDNSGYAGFFPFGGNSNKYSNTGFGTEFDISFYMTTSGALQGADGTSQDIMFSFSGDDDVWVYVDGVKVLDLGGDHKVSAGAINFTDGKVYYKSAVNKVGSVSTTSDNWAYSSDYVKTVDLVDLLASNGVTFSATDATTKHTLQMFYMERGAYQSNCSISFNLPQASGLSVRNSVLADNVNKGLKDAALAASNEDYFTYKVGNMTAPEGDITTLIDKGGIYANAIGPNVTGTWTASNAYPVYPYAFDITRVFGGKSLVLGSSSTSTAAKTGGSTLGDLTGSWQYLNNSVYSLSDRYAQAASSEAKLSGITDNSTGEFHLLGGEMANFSDKVRPNSYVQVMQTQTMGEAKPGTNNVIGFNTVLDNNVGNYYTTSYRIYDEAAKKDVVPETDFDIAYGDNDTFYANDESAATNGFYFTNYANDSSNVNPAMTVDFYNNIAVGDLIISKEVTGSSTSTDNFYFTVEFANIFGDDSNSSFATYDVDYKVYNIEDDTPVSGATQSYGTVGIVIKPGQYAKIEGIPVETRFRVTEHDRAGYAVSNIDKTCTKPNGAEINYTAKDLDTGFYNYLNQAADTENFSNTILDKTYVDNNNTPGDETDDYTYYCNMVPTVSESLVSGTNNYISKSIVAYSNKKLNFTIQFKYYDRYEINGEPAGINSSATTYTKTVDTIPDEDKSGNQIVKYVNDDPSAGVQEIYFDRLIAMNATAFVEDTLINNVMCQYNLWTSQDAAVTAMASKKYFDANGNQQNYPEEARQYHTTYLGKPQTSGEKWVSYYDSKGTEVTTFEAASDYLKVRNIVVWCYNYPRQYSLDIYGAKSFSDLDSSAKTVGGQEVYVASTNTSSSVKKSRENGVYYNQRLGTVVTGADDLNAAGFISNYHIPGVYNNGGTISPLDYASESFKNGNDTYTFAYWAYDAGGTQIASTDIKYKYRITKDTKLYAVYIKGETVTGNVGMSLTANVNDTYVDSSGTSRTRLNIIGSVNNAEDYDKGVKKLAFVNIILSNQIRSKPEVYTPARINELFIKYQNQLKSIIEAQSGSSPFNFKNEFDGDFTKTNPYSFDSTIKLTLTTQGYIYTVTSNGNEAAAGDATIQLTNKNRAQFTMTYKTSALNADGNGTGNTCLVYSGAVKYDDSWTMSDNCLIYYNGSVVDNSATGWPS